MLSKEHKRNMKKVRNIFVFFFLLLTSEVSSPFVLDSISSLMSWSCGKQGKKLLWLQALAWWQLPRIQAVTLTLKSCVKFVFVFWGCLYAAKWWIHCGRAQILLCQTRGFESRIKEMEWKVSVGGNMGIIQASEHVPQQRCFILNKRRGRCWRKLQIEVAN